MTQEELAQTLDSLHNSLSDSPPIDTQTAEKLRMLIGEIQSALARSEASADSTLSHGTLTQRMRAIIADFEVHHPKLTANLSLIAERLADMGI